MIGMVFLLQSPLLKCNNYLFSPADYCLLDKQLQGNTESRCMVLPLGGILVGFNSLKV